jgi:hypothetical protein
VDQGRGGKSVRNHTASALILIDSSRHSSQLCDGSSIVSNLLNFKINSSHLPRGIHKSEFVPFVFEQELKRELVGVYRNENVS